MAAIVTMLRFVPWIKRVIKEAVKYVAPLLQDNSLFGKNIRQISVPDHLCERETAGYLTVPLVNGSNGETNALLLRMSMVGMGKLLPHTCHEAQLFLTVLQDPCTFQCD